MADKKIEQQIKELNDSVVKLTNLLENKKNHKKMWLPYLPYSRMEVVSGLRDGKLDKTLNKWLDKFNAVQESNKAAGRPFEIIVDIKFAGTTSMVRAMVLIKQMESKI